MNLPQQRHDVATIRRIQVARGLVGQDDRRIVGERPSKGDALLFTTGKFSR